MLTFVEILIPDFFPPQLPIQCFLLRFTGPYISGISKCSNLERTFLSDIMIWKRNAVVFAITWLWLSKRQLSLLIMMHACNTNRSELNVFDRRGKLWPAGPGQSCLSAEHKTSVSVHERQRDLLKLACRGLGRGFWRNFCPTRRRGSNFFRNKTQSR